jgi:hypothetical protein
MGASTAMPSGVGDYRADAPLDWRCARPLCGTGRARRAPYGPRTVGNSVRDVGREEERDRRPQPQEAAPGNFAMVDARDP